MQGFSEGLQAELKPFDIRVTDVAPGYFRTNFLNPDSMVTPKYEIEAYKEVRTSQELHQHTINGNQQGDPEKAVAVIIEAADSQNPPLHLFLGPDAYDLAYQKMEAIQQDLTAWKELATATSFAEELVLS
jgi:NAD(P)-dependent dehydrogenase (short-subunit alcohol dehydrogenase family)